MLINYLGILPDEIDRGYLGRVMSINQLENKTIALRALRQWAGDAPVARKGPRTGTLEYLSRLAGIPLSRFIAAHTTLPWRRAITPHKVNVEHGGEGSRSIISISGFRLIRKGAYFCADCVSEDMTKRRFSYWRRSHQLPGCLSCDRHGTPLAKVRDEWAFLNQPAHYVHCQEKVTLTPPNYQEELPIQRFQRIAAALMSREHPIHTAVVRQVLHQRGELRGFQVSSGEVKRPLLSDLIRRTFPSQWLAEVFPAALKSVERKLFLRLDGVFFFRRGSSTVAAYFLALAVLFDSVEDALAQLAQFEARPLVSTPRNVAGNIDSHSIVVAYIDAAGSHPRAATLCGISPFLASKRLSMLGLPSLPRSQLRDKILISLHAYFLEQRCLTEAALIGGIPIHLLEDLLRKSCPLFSHALQAIHLSKS